jgi:serine/threonine protein kinase
MGTSGTGAKAYEQLREFSNNESGSTIKALAPESRKTVVVRSIRPGPCTDPSIEAVLAAATKALALNSPNIVLAHEAYEEDGLVYIVMDYAEGVTLATALSNGKLSDWDMVDTARQVCAAIDHAHSRSLSHPNLNPANIVQEWDGTVKVVDYGVSVDLLQQVAKNPVRVQAAQYLSPEQTRGIAPDRRSNLFSLAVVLYEMATGQKPFAANDADTVFEQIRTKEPIPPHLSQKKYGPAFSKMLLKALTKAPEERYASGAEFVRELEAAMQSKAPAVQVPVAPVKPPTANADVVANGVRGSGDVSPSPTTVPTVDRVVRTTGPAAEDGGATKPPAAPQSDANLGARGRSNAAGQSTPIPNVQSKPGGVQSQASAPTPAQAPVKSAVPEPPPKKLEGTPRSEFLIVGPRRETAPVTPQPVAPQSKPAQAIVQPDKPATRDQSRVPTQATPRIPSQQTQSTPAAKPSRRILPMHYIVAAMFLVLAGLGLGMLLRSSRPSTTPPSSLEQQAETTSESSAMPPVVVENSAPPTDSGQTRDSHASARKNKQKPGPAPTVAAPVTGMIAVESTPAGAAIRIDGQPTSALTPRTFAQLSPGAHTISVSRAGFDEATRTVQVVAGQTSPVSFTLTEARAIVAITSEPSGAEVAIDGSPTGRATPVTVGLLKGHHTFSFRKNGFLASTSSLDVAPGQNYRVEPRLTPLGDADQIKGVGRFKKLFGGGDMPRLQFRTVPKGAQIVVNQRVMDKVTPAEFAFPPGHYQVTLSAPGYKPYQATIEVEQGTNKRVEAVLQPASK